MATDCLSEWRFPDGEALSLDQPETDSWDRDGWNDSLTGQNPVATRARAASLLACEIRFVDNQPNESRGAPLDAVPPGGDRAVLSADEEVILFREMNANKRQASELRQRLSMSRPVVQLMDEIENLLQSAESIRNRLVTTFLGLGFSIARRFSTAEFPFDELSSEANMTLLLAVDRYDCDRGFRFSTYATHAIRRNLVRYLVSRRKDKLNAMATENLDSISDFHKWTWNYERQVKATIDRLEGMFGDLDPRDVFILKSRCGLAQSSEVQSLQSLAEKLGISRERVRQLEQRATLRLRAMAKRQDLDSLHA